jgi:hypothetical protein
VPLHTWRRIIETVLDVTLGQHNKPKAVVHTVVNDRPIEEEEEEEEEELTPFSTLAG